MARWQLLRALPLPAGTAAAALLQCGDESGRGRDWRPRTWQALRCEEHRRPVAVVGDVFVDVMARVQGLPVWDGDTEAEYVKVLPGGSALNQARHLHALGRPVRFFGAVGGDAFGGMLVSHVAAQGFPTEGIKVFKDLPSSVCLVLTGPADRAFVSCYSTTDAYSSEDLKWSMGKPEECAHLHIGGYFNLKGLMNGSFTDLVRSCRARGLTVSVNTQFDASEAWTGTGGHLAELLPLVNLLVVNKTEAESIARKLAKDPTDDPLAICRAFPQLTLVVTRGSEGCDVLRAGQPTVRVPTELAASIVDATGAGDAFLAGFLRIWLARKRGASPGEEEEMLKAACAMGNRVARVCLGRDGACVEPVRPPDLGE